MPPPSAGRRHGVSPCAPRGWGRRAAAAPPAPAPAGSPSSAPWPAPGCCRSTPSTSSPGPIICRCSPAPAPGTPPYWTSPPAPARSAAVISRHLRDTRRGSGWGWRRTPPNGRWSTCSAPGRWTAWDAPFSSNGCTCRPTTLFRRSPRHPRTRGPRARSRPSGRTHRRRRSRLRRRRRCAAWQPWPPAPWGGRSGGDRGLLPVADQTGAPGAGRSRRGRGAPGGGGRPPRRPTPDAAAPRGPRCYPAPGHRSGQPLRPDRVLPAPAAGPVRRRLPDRELHPGRTPHEGLLLPAVPARRPPPRPGRPQGGPRGRSVASARHLPGGAAVDARPARPGGRHRGPRPAGGSCGAPPAGRDWKRSRWTPDPGREGSRRC